MQRECKTCLIEKPLDQFSKNHTYKHGRTYKCVKCYNEHQRNNYTYIKPVTIQKRLEENGKVCSKCKEFKSLDLFSKKHTALDGLKSQCKACQGEAQKIYASANSESLKLKTKEINSRPEVLARKNTWARAHLELGRENLRIRRARLKECFVERIDDYLVYLVNSGICQICLCPIDRSLKFPNKMSFTIDHIYPISLGGEHSYDNVQSAHYTCNCRKHNKVEVE